MTDTVINWIEIVGVHGIRLLLIFAGVLLLIRLVETFCARLVQPAKTQTRVAQLREQQTRAAAEALRKAGTGAVLLIGLLVGLPELGFTILPVATLVGLAVLALGFGFRSTLHDIANGLIAAFEDQYVIGDTIRANGETGRVEQISLRRTVLRNERGAMVSIANGSIGQVANLSRDWSQTAVDITVPADETVGRVLTLLEKVAADFRDDPDWSPALVDGPRVLGIESIAPEGTNVRMQMRTALLRQEDVARELRRRIKIALEEAGISGVGARRMDTVISTPKPA